MSKMNRWMALAGVAALTCFGTGHALAQNNGGGGGNFQNWRNMSPEERQQAMMNNVKEELEVKDDAEWSVIQPLVQKVMEARREAFTGGGGMGMMRGRNRGGGGDQGGDQGGQGGRNRGGGMFGQNTPNPERDALQKAIDSKAPKAEVKAALDKYTASRKDKQAQLEKAQADLRKVLTSRQEAIATLNGLL
jgi:hypothetical protein